ncbi:MAG: ribosome maturation factor RimP [Deltaproteobacteria bacterium]|nr:ribosome maturation factor RimP [Deltaproteobacteria bacterium]
MDLDALNSKVRELAQPALKAAGLELVDVEMRTQRGRFVIQVVVDKPGGVNVDDCAELSRYLGDLLDVHQVMDQSYLLEVSSPGLDRPLVKPADFAWAVGRPIKVTTRQPLQGRNVLTGRLSKFDGQELTLEAEGQALRVALSQVAKARLNVDPFGRDQASRQGNSK